jgi:DNA adenine methylase
MNNEELPNNLKPPLKWAGGKRWLVPELNTIWQPYQHHRLVEPFCGGLAVALGLQPRKALLNDANPHLINFYRQIQKGFRIPIKMQNDSELFYSYRNQFNRSVTQGRVTTARAAQLFYYLNRSGYNGLCRFNRKGEFNVPFGKYQKINYRRDFIDYQSTLAGWQFKSGDFQNLKLRDSDFIYADPPYDVAFRQYAAQGFEFCEQERLAEWLSQHPGPVVLSNQATPKIKKLYKSLNYKLLYRDAPRMIACNGNRKRAVEVLAIRNLELPSASIKL